MFFPRGRNESRDGEHAPDWAARFRSLAENAANPSLRDFYAAGAVEPEQPLSGTPLAAIDLETTGLDPNRHAIVSIGVVPFTIERIRCAESRYWVIKPRRELVSESVTIHRITHEELENAPDFREVIDDLLDVLSGRVAVVHYRAIERRFLDTAVEERLGEGLAFPLIDTMDLEARVHRRRPPGPIARLMGRKPASLRLAESRQRYNLPLYSPHHALTDALATAELFQAQVAHRYSTDTPIGELWR